MSLTVGDATKDIVTRLGKGAPLDIDEHDQNLNNMVNEVNTLDGKAHEHSNKGALDAVPDHTGAQTGDVLKKQSDGSLAFEAESDSFSGDYTDLQNKPDLSTLHEHTNKSTLDAVPDHTGAQTGDVLKKQSDGSLAFEAEQTITKIALPVLTGSNGSFVYDAPKDESVFENTLVTDGNNYALITFNDFNLLVASWSNPYSSGDRRSILTISLFDWPPDASLIGMIIDGNSTYQGSFNNGIVEIIFPNLISLVDIRNTNGSMNLKNDLKYSSDLTSEFVSTDLSSPIVCRRIRSDLSIGGGTVGDIEFNYGDPATFVDLNISGDNITPNYRLDNDEQKVKFIEFDFASFTNSSEILITDKGYQFEFPYPGVHKILKMDVISTSITNINTKINGSDVFQSAVTTGANNKSGLVISDQNSITQGDILDFSSSGIGTGLLVRVWFMKV